MTTQEAGSGSDVFDQPYWGNIIKVCFPGAKRIDEHWTQKTVTILVPLADWESASRLRFEPNGYDFETWVRAFSGLRDRRPAVTVELKVSDGGFDGFSEGEKFIRVTLNNVGFPDRRHLI